MTIRELIVKRRSDIGMTQSELAKFTGIGQSRISEFESGMREMTSGNLDKILDTLDVRLSLVANSVFDYPEWLETQEDYPESAEVDYFDEEHPNLLILENEKYWSINNEQSVATLYPKKDWTLESAIDEYFAEDEYNNKGLPLRQPFVVILSSITLLCVAQLLS